MSIECILFGPFREDVGKKTVSVPVGRGLDSQGNQDARSPAGQHSSQQSRSEPASVTAHELLEKLETAYPVLAGRLVDEAAADGLAGKTVVTKNKTDIRHLEGLETPVGPDDTIRLVPSVYGGSGPRPCERRRSS